MNELLLIVVIQICLESLPVSSSGHLMLISMLCQVVNGYSFAMPEHFDHLLHGPTLIVLGVFFFSSWWLMFKTIARSLLCWLRGKAIPASHQKALMVYARIVGWVVCADLVTVFMYGVGKMLIKKEFVVFSTDVLLFAGLCMTMLLMLVLWVHERKSRGDDSIPVCHPRQGSARSRDGATSGLEIQNNSHAFGRRVHCVGCSQFSVAIIMGFIQGFALIPGVSRFASTFVGARLFGMSARRAFATSFAMLAPLASAGFLFNGVRELIAHPAWFQLFTPGLLATMIFSTVGAYLLFAGAHRMACAQRLWWFGWYMLVPITALIALMVLR